jgi:hypothetical protein
MGMDYAGSSRRPIGDPFEGEVSPNSLRNRWNVLTDEALREQYYEAAKRAGISNFGPKTELSPIQITDQLLIRTDTDTHDGIPVVLNADVPTARLRFRFQDPAFIRRLTAEVTAVRLLGVGQPEPGFFGGSVNPLDYIYIQFRRDGAGQVYQTYPISMSQALGKGRDSYFWDLIPCVQGAGSILADVSLIPPGPSTGGAAPTEPPFVERVGFLQVAMHCERFNPFGD